MKILKPKTNTNYYISQLKNFGYRLYFSFFKKRKYQSIFLGHKMKMNRLSKLEDFVNIGDFVDIRGSYVGKGTYISDYTKLSYCKIGKYCQVGECVNVVIGTHPVGRNVSTHPAFYSTLGQAGFTFVDETSYESSISVNGHYVCEIGNDVWIGSYVKILNGVKIGDGSVIACGAIVTEDVPPYTIVGGVPARKIRQRFDDETIQFLINHPWYDLPMDNLSKNYSRFLDIDNYKDWMK